ncbi:MAG TPA: nitroreductase family protein, partial [Planctomycetes bacterium]|nr:nitroreductase family protein [Planctomycetaceae bacterium]HIM30741.1 nitroreductase family protein [Planctomycetota bacterium]
SYSEAETLSRSRSFYEEIRRRRTVREFSDREIPEQVLENCLLSAGTAPSGANLQPWQFVVVRDPKVKKTIRREAEEEEREFYQHRAPQEWLDALAPLGTDSDKPFLEIAPCLIVIFRRTVDVDDLERKVKQYYSAESVGIATGLLIAALHHCGLVTLTHTPSPMKFLNEILSRPTTERPFLILVAGYPAEAAQVPVITKKRLDEIATWI